MASPTTSSISNPSIAIPPPTAAPRCSVHVVSAPKPTSGRLLPLPRRSRRQTHESTAKTPAPRRGRGSAEATLARDERQPRTHRRGCPPPARTLHRRLRPPLSPPASAPQTDPAAATDRATRDARRQARSLGPRGARRRAPHACQRRPDDRGHAARFAEPAHGLLGAANRLFRLPAGFYGLVRRLHDIRPSATRRPASGAPSSASTEPKTLRRKLRLRAEATGLAGPASGRRLGSPVDGHVKVYAANGRCRNTSSRARNCVCGLSYWINALGGALCLHKALDPRARRGAPLGGTGRGAGSRRPHAEDHVFTAWSGASVWPGCGVAPRRTLDDGPAGLDAQRAHGPPDHPGRQVPLTTHPQMPLEQVAGAMFVVAGEQARAVQPPAYHRPLGTGVNPVRRVLETIRRVAAAWQQPPPPARNRRERHAP